MDKTAGMNKAKKFLKQRQNDADIVTYTCTAGRASADHYSDSRTRND